LQKTFVEDYMYEFNVVKKTSPLHLPVPKMVASSGKETSFRTKKTSCQGVLQVQSMIVLQELAGLTENSSPRLCPMLVRNGIVVRLTSI
jgi:hypothetical protein